MYEQFFGLRDRPFELTPNPRYLLLTARHREALSHLEYGITARRGITVLTGEAGTGKTTLVRCALGRRLAAADSGRPGVYVTLNNPTLDRREFIEYLAIGLQLSSEAATSKARFLVELEQSLVARRRSGAAAALVVDEAQSMPHELLEEIRLLANVESETEKLLPVILVGQPELADRLNEPGLRQLKQRVALRCRLEPLDVNQTASYIASRLSIAGGNAARIFTREAVLAVYARSRGIPRTINVICDNALVSAYALDRRSVGADIITEVGEDFDLTAGPVPAAAAATPSGGPGASLPVGGGQASRVLFAEPPAKAPDGRVSQR